MKRSTRLGLLFIAGILFASAGIYLYVEGWIVARRFELKHLEDETEAEWREKLPGWLIDDRVVFYAKRVDWDNWQVHGPITGWHENGQKHMQFAFTNGKRVGFYISWHKNGQKDCEVTTTVEGHSVGIVTYWHENGQKWLEFTEIKEKLEGPKVFWYENGQKESEKFYVDGVIEGVSRGWYENGKRDWERTLVKGNWHGKWTEWNEDGSISSITYWDNGTILPPSLPFNQATSR